MKSIYDIIGRIGDPLIDVAMIEALPTADEAAAQQIVALLITRATDGGLRGLLRHFHELSDGLQKRVVESGSRFDAAIRHAAANGDHSERVNAVELITRCGSVRLAYLLADQLHEDDVVLAKAAAAGLLRLTRQCVEDVGTLALPRERAMQWLAAAVSQACGSYGQHGRRDVLLAAACMAQWRPAEVLRRLGEKRSAALPALREIVRRGDEPMVESRLLALATWEPLEGAVVESLRERSGGQRVPGILGGVALVGLPALRMTLSRIGPANHLLPSAAQLAAMEPAQLRALPRWVESIHAEDGAKVEVLERVAVSSDRWARLGALRALQAIGTPEADESIATLCFDDDALLARVALRHLVLRDYKGLTQLTVRLVASVHAEVRMMAERELTRLGFGRLWQHWDQLEPATRRSAGRALMKIDSNFHRHLAERMGGSKDDRFRAVKIARELSQERFFEPQLIKLVRDTDERVASSAAMALGAMQDSPVAARELTAALDHPDDRVRSNAVESLEKMHQVDQARQKLQELAATSGNRSRATALKALLSLPAGGAVPALDAMLGDPDPKHRISALWVAEQMGVIAVGRKIAELAANDQDAKVRLRAMRIFRLLAAASPALAAPPAAKATTGGAP